MGSFFELFGFYMDLKTCFIIYVAFKAEEDYLKQDSYIIAYCTTVIAIFSPYMLAYSALLSLRYSEKQGEPNKFNKLSCISKAFYLMSNLTFGLIWFLPVYHLETLFSMLSILPALIDQSAGNVVYGVGTTLI